MVALSAGTTARTRCCTIASSHTMTELENRDHGDGNDRVHSDDNEDTAVNSRYLGTDDARSDGEEDSDGDTMIESMVAQRHEMYRQIIEAERGDLPQPQQQRQQEPIFAVMAALVYIIQAYAHLFTVVNFFASMFLLGTRDASQTCVPEYTVPFAITITVFCGIDLLYYAVLLCKGPRDTLRHSCSRGARKWLKRAIIFLGLLMTVNGPTFGIFGDGATACSRGAFPTLLHYVRVFYIVFTASCVAIPLLVTLFIMVLFCGSEFFHWAWVEALVTVDHNDAPSRRVRQRTMRELTQLVPFSDLMENDDAERDRCAICLDGFIDEESDDPAMVRVLGCGHYFHDDCISPYLTQQRGACPLCKQPIRNAHDLRSTAAVNNEEDEEDEEESRNKRLRPLSPPNEATEERAERARRSQRRTRPARRRRRSRCIQPAEGPD